MSKLRVFDENEISARLARDLPKWTYENGAISRTFRTENWKGALMVVNTIGHLAEAAWHHPDLHVTYSSVTVRLNTHDAGGVTDRDMALASRIEDVVMWRPGLSGGPFESAPAGPAYAYLHYDD